jgi:hypothetical protein
LVFNFQYQFSDYSGVVLRRHGRDKIVIGNRSKKINLIRLTDPDNKKFEKNCDLNYCNAHLENWEIQLDSNQFQQIKLPWSKNQLLYLKIAGLNPTWTQVSIGNLVIQLPTP